MKFYEKTDRKLLRLVVLFSAATLTQTSFATVNLNYHVASYTTRAHELMDDHGENELYKVSIDFVDDYLPKKEKIKRTPVKLVAHHVLPGKCALKFLRHMFIIPNPVERSQRPKDFFGGLPEGKNHTYAVLNDKLIFTETTRMPKEQPYIDKFSKHFLITSGSKYVNYAGEFEVIKNRGTNEVFVVFDNASGTYKPKTKNLPNLKKLLDANFADDGLYLLTKSFGQKIDQKQLFVDKNIVPVVDVQ